MLSDPIKGLRISLLVAALPVVWLLALWIDADAIYRRLGMSMHAITFLAIFAFICGLLVAGMFRRFMTVKRELLAGRRVYARWSVGREAFEAFAPKAAADDKADKKQILFIIWLFLAIGFGGFALYDPEVAGPMLGMGAAVAMIVSIAFVLGQRVTQKHLEFRGGEVIVGERGLLNNGVLHVWGLPLSWLSSAELSEDGKRLMVVHGHWARYGPQYYTVALPVTPESLDDARRAEQKLMALAGKTPAKRRRKPAA